MPRLSRNEATPELSASVERYSAKRCRGRAAAAGPCTRYGPRRPHALERTARPGDLAQQRVGPLVPTWPATGEARTAPSRSVTTTSSVSGPRLDRGEQLRDLA